MTESRTAPPSGDRLAKVMARSGLCSRRDAEDWIRQGRVAVNGTKVVTPAFNVTEADEVKVDGAPLAARQGTRVWLYHKPAGLMVTEKDPEGRPTIFEKLGTQGLPRVVTIGRLDFNTEGLLLLTNDGGLKRVLELPATGWLRKYRVRAHGTITQDQLDTLKSGTTLDGVKYGPIEATFKSERGANVWLEVALREGKNREVRNVLFALGLEVNRLIRISYGPFQLGDLPVGAVEPVKARILKDQLGARLAAAAGADFTTDAPTHGAPVCKSAPSPSGRGTTTAKIAQQRFRFTDRPDRSPDKAREDAPRPSRPGRYPTQPERRPVPPQREAEVGPPRHILFEDGTEPKVFEKKTYGKPRREPESERNRPPRQNAREDRSFRSGDTRPAGKDWGGPREPGRHSGAGRPANKSDGPVRAGSGKPRSSRAEAARPARGPSGRAAPAADKRASTARPKSRGPARPVGPRSPRGPRPK